MSIVVRAASLTERGSTTLTILEFPEPTLEPQEFLIENVAVATNPTDWKRAKNPPSLPWTNGGDVAGTVVRVGSAVTKFKLGDRVTSFVSRKTARHGGYQTHSIGEEDRTVHLPQKYTFEAGSTIPLAYVTAAASLADTLGVTFPSVSPTPAQHGTPLLVWGGSSSVGAYGIQLAKLAGYKVITTASKANHEYVRSLGADVIFDYHDSDVVDKIRSAAGDKLSLVLDTISEKGTIEQSAESVTASSGIVATILPVPDKDFGSVQVLLAGAILAFEKPEIGKVVYKTFQEHLDAGVLIPNPQKIIPGGLNGVEEGWKLSLTGKVSAEKLVYRIADTQF